MLRGCIVPHSFVCCFWWLQVWEVKGADLTVSPVQQAGVGVVHPSKGISLRFPRFMRIRDDKNPDDATNAGQIVELYNGQFANGGGGGN